MVIVLLSGSLMILNLLMIVGAIGVVVIPYAAYTAYRRAKQEGYDPVKYATLGALYSSLLLLPWFILLGKLSDRDSSIGWALSILYFSWLFGPITLTFFNVEILDEEGFVDPLLIFTAGCLMLFAWGGSLIWLRILNKRSNQPVYHPMNLRERLLTSRRRQSDGQLPEHGYIVPFVCAAISLLAALGLMVFIG